MADASIVLAWCFPDEAEEYPQLALSSVAAAQIVVPVHWALEVSNGLLMAERRGRTSMADTATALRLLADLPLTVDAQTFEAAQAETLSLARTYGLTVYDAAYVELAQRMALPLATLDSRLASICAKAHVALYQP